MKTYPIFVQLLSSVKSLQSLSLSHTQVFGMQRPLPHSNWSTVQFTAKAVDENTNYVVLLNCNIK